MTDQTYTATLDLRDAPVVVIGGGQIATRKVLSLIRAGAVVRVVSPKMSQELQNQARQGALRWTCREYRHADLSEPALLTFAATDDEKLNARIVEDGRRRGKLVNGSNAEAGRNFSTPASFTRDGLTVSVASHGENVSGAISLRNRLRNELDEEDACYVAAHVTLVGAGPGGVDLLTLGGKRALRAADVVLYDNLIDEEVLKLVQKRARLIYVGKKPFGEHTTQEEINALLIKHALEGRYVVRLKGGDPFIFGRGAEEVEVLHQAGISVNVIAGVSSLNGALASAGVSITKRLRNQGFAAFAATPRTDDREIRAWARVPGPVVVFMGVHAAGRIVEMFQAVGRSHDEAVTVISQGGTSEQRTYLTTLARLDHLFENKEDWTPALIVVGATPEAAFAERVTKVESDGLRKVNVA